MFMCGGKNYTDQEVHDALSFWGGKWIFSNEPKPEWFLGLYSWLGEMNRRATENTGLPSPLEIEEFRRYQEAKGTVKTVVLD